jgi:hypothetical protein
MKLLAALALVACFASSMMLTSTTFAQTSKSTTKKKTTTKTTTRISSSNAQPSSAVGAEVSGITGSAPGDPYNLNHPYFNGDARWSHPDTMYAHGDFPWAMVADHPENFRFNPDSGRWEIIGTPPPSMGTSKSTR